MPADAPTTRRRSGRRLLVKELSAFGIVGGFCFLLDVGLFQLLYAQFGVGAVTSKLLATLVSMTVAYLGHRYWSFSHRERTGLGRGYAVFAVINGGTLALGLGIVGFVRYGLDQEGALVLQLANVGSIAVGTVIRYVSYRRLLFTAPAAPAPAVTPDAGLGPAVTPDAGLGRAYRAAPATGNS